MGSAPIWFSSRRRPGPTREALEAALIGADLAGSRRIWAELARSAADLADSARRAQDPRLWFTAAGRLESLLGKVLPEVPGDGAAGERGAGAGAGLPAGLAGALGAAPSLGDQEEP